MSQPERRNVAFLGGGRMGEAFVSGLIRSGGRRTEEITVTARRGAATATTSESPTSSSE